MSCSAYKIIPLVSILPEGNLGCPSAPIGALIVSVCRRLVTAMNSVDVAKALPGQTL